MYAQVGLGIRVHRTDWYGSSVIWKFRFRQIIDRSVFWKIINRLYGWPKLSGRFRCLPNKPTWLEERREKDAAEAEENLQIGIGEGWRDSRRHCRGGGRREARQLRLYGFSWSWGLGSECPERSRHDVEGEMRAACGVEGWRLYTSAQIFWAPRTLSVFGQYQFFFFWKD